jgi:hypothetical protein
LLSLVEVAERELLEVEYICYNSQITQGRDCLVDLRVQGIDEEVTGGFRKVLRFCCIKWLTLYIMAIYWLARPHRS